MQTPATTLDRAPRLSTLIVTAFAAAVIPLSAIAAPPPGTGDWPQYRGKNGTGISTERGWSSDGKSEALRKINVGRGYSSVAVTAGRLYTIGHDEASGEDSVVCLDAASGEKVWTHTFIARIDAKYHGGGSLTTPSIDRDRVYVTNRDGKLLCLGASAGEQRFDCADVVVTALGSDIADIKFAVISDAVGGQLLAYSRLSTSQYTVTAGNTHTITIASGGIFELN